MIVRWRSRLAGVPFRERRARHARNPRGDRLGPVSCEQEGGTTPWPESRPAAQPVARSTSCVPRSPDRARRRPPLPVHRERGRAEATDVPRPRIRPDRSAGRALALPVMVSRIRAASTSVARVSATLWSDDSEIIPGSLNEGLLSRRFRGRSRRAALYRSSRGPSSTVSSRAGVSSPGEDARRHWRRGRRVLAASGVWEPHVTDAFRGRFTRATSASTSALISATTHCSRRSWSVDGDTSMHSSLRRAFSDACKTSP